MVQVPNNMQNQNNRGLYAPRLPSPAGFRSTFGDPPMTLPGYFVNSEDDIIIRDVQMDGSISYFPTRDLSKIFIRQWNKQGDLESLTYVLQQPVQPQEQQPQAPLPAPPPPPAQDQQPQPSQQEVMMMQTLNSLNNGLASTFNQFGSVLQSMQDRMESISHQIDSIPRFTVDDGGQG